VILVECSHRKLIEKTQVEMEEEMEMETRQDEKAVKTLNRKTICCGYEREREGSGRGENYCLKENSLSQAATSADWYAVG